MGEDKCRLDALPPEIQILIMTHTSSLHSLYALIRASRHLYRVFSLSKQRIISATIHEMVHPEALPDAWANALLSCRETPLRTHEDSLAFIEIYEKDKKNYQVPKLIPLTMCKTICQLHRSVEYFGRDFVDWCATVCAKQGFSLGAGSLSLSWTEEGRIQRAFYRLQLHGRLLCFANVNGDGFLDAYNKSGISLRFVQNLSGYQIEELACLRHYLLVRLDDVYDRIEDEFVVSVLAKISESDESDEEESDESDDEESKENQDNEDIEGSHGSKDCERPACNRPPDWLDPVELNNDFFFGKTHKRFHIFYTAVQITKGLPLLRQFLEAGISEQINLVKRFSSPRSEPLNFIFSRPHESILKLEETVSFCKDDINKPNEAYLWMNNTVPYTHDPMGLRECGYVFWDSVRLRSSGMMTEYVHPTLIYKTAANLY
ncbi:hypothetical protein MMC22_004868 [Lobaria immixta]|nr:hypothetical protein [Lobaria immixta]